MKPSGGRSERQEEELDVLQEYVRSSDEIIAKSVQRYVGFVCRRKRVVDPTRWTLINSERGLRVYKERVELRSMKSFVSANEHDSYDVEREGRGKSATQHSAKTSREHSTGSDRRGSYIRFPSTMVSAFCIGKLRGSLDTVMAGLYADNTQDMHANCRIQFGDVLDCRVVQAFETESEAAPYGFFGVKWLEKQGHFPDVVDQLCWVERMGIHTISSGRRFGYQLLKSMHLEAETRARDASTRPVNVSLCYLYCQIDEDVVEVFARGIVEIVMDSDSGEENAVRAAGAYILAAVRGRECGRMRKITELIGQSKTERDRLTACHCSKVIKGLPKVEMCTECQQAMLQPKLLDVRELMRTKKDATEAPAKPQLLLKSRLGSLRHDAELPDTIKSYRESQSFRMFLPIHDPRPSSSYRQNQKESDNVLMQMLRKNQHRSTYLPEFLRANVEDTGTQQTQVQRPTRSSGGTPSSASTEPC